MYVYEISGAPHREYIPSWEEMDSLPAASFLPSAFCFLPLRIIHCACLVCKAWKHQVMLYRNKVMRIPFLLAHGCIILLQG